MARKRKTRHQAQKLWLALFLAAIVVVQLGYFIGAAEASQRPPPAATQPENPQVKASVTTQPVPGLEPEPDLLPSTQKPRGGALLVEAVPSITPPSQDPSPEALDRPRQPPAPASRPTPTNPQASAMTDGQPRGEASTPAAGVVRRVVPLGEEKLVALTFDDGPWPDTLAVLEVLRQYGAKATFFWVGLHLQKRPEIAQQVVAEGHAVGNHTWSHRNTPMTPDEAAEEIERTAALIEQATGQTTFLFRPPGGRLHNGLADYALQRGYTVVQWSVLSEDTKTQDATYIADNVLRNIQPGSIVLLHDGGGDRAQTVAALHSILPALRAQGFRFVTVPELLESARATLRKPAN